MKFLFLSALAILGLLSCKNKSGTDAENLASGIRQTREQNSPAMIAASADGYTVRASIDGREWQAETMLKNDNVSKHYKYVRGEKDGDYLQFQIPVKSVRAGRVKSLSKEFSINLGLGNEILSSESGELTITNVTADWIEGNFQFVATDKPSGRKANVTDGFFRISAK